MSGKEQLVVLLDEWVPQPRRLERDEALAEWALRYFTSHGPATPKDFAWWTGLVSADVRAALAIARARLQQVEVDGVEHWMGTGTADALAACRDAAEGVFLLPGFDENLLGYSAVGRRAALPAEFAGRIVPGGNGIFQPTVVAAGQVVGTWRRPPRPPGAPVVAAPFTTFAPEVEAAVARRAAALP